MDAAPPMLAAINSVYTLDLRRIFAIIYANNAEISIASAENNGHDLRRRCGEWLLISMRGLTGPSFDGTGSN